MPLPVTRLRRWFAACAILMIAIVAGMYFYARWRVRRAIHQVPIKLGVDIQQSAEGFSISKSFEGRTEFTVSASKAVQFKQGGIADLRNVKIIVYGRDSSRFDRISGDQFEFDPNSGTVTAKGRVLIDLQSNPEGIKSSDQAAPPETTKPIHLETDDLVFNKNTGDAFANGKVIFQTPQATGSAIGVDYISHTGTMTLRSTVQVTVNRPRPYDLTAEHGVINKAPHTIFLTHARLTRQQQEMQSDEATMFLREDNTVDRILADGNVESAFQGSSNTHTRSDHAEMFLSGNRNQITTAILTGNVQLTTEGAQPAEAYAGRATLNFGANQILKTVHAEDNVRLYQQRQGTSTGAAAPASALSSGGPQNVEMTAPVMDFVVKNGRLLESAVTAGPPRIVITQPATKQTTVVTADRFTATFTANNRLSLLHGEPNAKVVGTTPGQPDRVSTSPVLDVFFQPQGGISTIIQSGGLYYVSGTQKAWAQKGTYTDADQLLVLTGSPRIVDGGMTTTAQTIRFNRATGDAFADGNVKSTYSDLKAQPDGGMLASSDPIHVVSHSMTAHRSSSIAIYTGSARLWQDSNVVEAPTLQFDRNNRSLVADSSPTQPVRTVLVQIDKNGNATPVATTSTDLTYNDPERKAFLTGKVTTKGADATMTAQQMTIFLVAHRAAESAAAKTAPSATSSLENLGQVEKIIAEKDVVVTEPSRRATGDRLVYTSADDKYVLTGGSPSIFDAEHGKITGDSLTFYRHDDRVLVEGKTTSPVVTRTQVAR